MVDLLVTNGTVVTVNENRDVIPNGAIAVDGDAIVNVGTTDEITANYDADETVDASGHAVFPGFIDPHVHVSDVFFRGGIGADRELYDWIFNVKIPGVGAMNVEEHTLASALYSTEAIQSGITTFVENAVGTLAGYSDDIFEAKVGVYDDAGLRNVYGDAFVDKPMDGEIAELSGLLMDKEPAVEHIDPETTIANTDDALDRIESRIKDFDGASDGRQSVWPAPVMPHMVSPEGIAGSYELAEEYDVMMTTHVAETHHETEGYQSPVEYLNIVGGLGERSLLGHCVWLDQRDIRLLAETDTRVAHNPLTNMALGAGSAPVPEMLNYGVTVGLGTDNSSGSDTVNMVNDMRFAALVHKGHHTDPSVMTAESVLEMATIGGARAIGREDDLGSIEQGKKADLALLNLAHPHLTPHHSVVSALVYQAQGAEISTVVCNGEVIMDDRAVVGLDDRFPNLREDATQAAHDAAERAGFQKGMNRPWKSIGR